MGNFNCEKLRSLRLARCMSLRDLATQCGMSATSISAWETGKYQPSAFNAATMAAVLMVEVGELFTAVPVFERAKLTRLRQGKNRSMRGLSREIGVSVTAVSRWESGADIPNDDHLHRLAAALEVPVMSLYILPIQIGRDTTGDIPSRRCKYTGCGQVIPSEARPDLQYCSAYHRKLARSHRLNDEGRCRACGDELARGSKIYCPRHLEKNRQYKMRSNKRIIDSQDRQLRLW